MTPKITVCMGSSCFARGNEQNLQIIESFLEKHQLKDEVDLFLKCSLCRSYCTKGPVMSLNNQEFESVDNIKTLLILQKALKQIKVL